MEFLYNKVAGPKETATQLLSCEIYKTFKNSSGGCFSANPGNLCGSLCGDGISNLVAQYHDKLAN